MSIAIKTPSIGLKGEFRVVVKDADTEEIRFDSGFQDNLITNWGLDRFGGYHVANKEGYGNSLNNYQRQGWAHYPVTFDLARYCQLGSGNAEPKVTDTGLQAFEAEVIDNNNAIADAATIIHLPQSNEYAMHHTTYYKFDRVINNKNISEIALSPYANNHEFKGVFTRALIKDALGQPTTLTVKSNEVLEVYYKLWAVVSAEVKESSIEATIVGADGQQTQRQIKVHTFFNFTSTVPRSVRLNLTRWNHSNNSGRFIYISKEGYNIPNKPTETITAKAGEYYQSVGSSSHFTYVNIPEDSYVPGSYKQRGRTFLDYNHISTDTMQRNGITHPNVNRISLPTCMGAIEFFFNNDGTTQETRGIPKTNDDTLEFIFEVSWERYTGDTTKLVG